MAASIDNTSFASSREIDQLNRTVTTVSFTFGTGTTTLYNIPAAEQVGGYMLFEAMYKIGTGAWQQFGRTFFVFSTATNLYVYNPSGAAVTMVVRFFIYTDKVDY